VLFRYGEQLDQLPLSSRDDVARAPLATQEAGSRASLDKYVIYISLTSI